MIPVIAKNLAQILVDGTSLSSTEQIDFSPPSTDLIGQSALTIYCYNIQESRSSGSDALQLWGCNAPFMTQIDFKSLRWFELSFLISAWDYTVLGEQQLLSEALLSLINHPSLPLTLLLPELQIVEELPLEISSAPTIDPVMLWYSLGLPIRPAVYLAIKVPILPRAGPSVIETSSSAHS